MSRNAQSNPWIGLFGICIAAGLVWLAFADLAVALPTISKELKVDLTDLQWVNNAFSLACGALVLAAGRFSDLYGRRRLLLLGVAVFGVFSLLTTFMSGFAGLIAGRTLMGVGAALILPSTLALIPHMFTRDKQPVAFGVWMAVAWVGQALGPLIGGALTSLIGWRSLFWVGALLCVGAYALIARYAVESRDENASRHVDYLGLVSSALAAFFLLYALTEGQEVGFSNPLIIGLIVASVVFAIAFVLIERRVHDPLVDLRLFKARDFDGALTANLVMNIVFAGLSYLLAIYLQDVRGYSALEAGVLLVPSALTILGFNPVGHFVSASRGPRSPVVWGLILLGLGTLLSGFLAVDSPYWILAAGLLILGAGLGLLSVPISDTAVAGPPADLAGTASGLFKMSSMLGGALGVAVYSAVAKVISGNRAMDEARAAGLSEDQIDQISESLTGSTNTSEALSNLPESTRDAIIAAYQQAYVDGVSGAIKLSAALALVSAVALLFIWPKKPKNAHVSEQARTK